MSDTYVAALAFNRGSDSRLMGLPKGLNPYTDTGLALAWAEGWRDVDLFWGAQAKRPIKRLPPVKDACCLNGKHNGSTL